MGVSLLLVRLAQLPREVLEPAFLGALLAPAASEMPQGAVRITVSVGAGFTASVGAGAATKRREESFLRGGETCRSELSCASASCWILRHTICRQQQQIP